MANDLIFIRMPPGLLPGGALTYQLGQGQRSEDIYDHVASVLHVPENSFRLIFHGAVFERGQFIPDELRGSTLIYVPNVVAGGGRRLRRY